MFHLLCHLPLVTSLPSVFSPCASLVSGQILLRPCAFTQSVCVLALLVFVSLYVPVSAPVSLSVFSFLDFLVFWISWDVSGSVFLPAATYRTPLVSFFVLQ